MNIFDFLQVLNGDENNPLSAQLNNAIYNLSVISKSIPTLVDNYLKLEEKWQKEYPKIKKIILEVASEEYAKNKAEELVDNYEKWGNYGWTLNAETNPTFFGSAPGTLDEANGKMESYCTVDTITRMCNELKEKGVNGQDIDEVLQCYKEEKYKSCSLLLFALLDHELIGLGYRYDNNKLKNGASAAKALLDDRGEQYKNELLVYYLVLLITIKAIMKLFENKADFTDEPNFINRHFVSHGMSNRDVTSLDCFRVISALYSFVVLFPIMEEA